MYFGASIWNSHCYFFYRWTCICQISPVDFSWGSNAGRWLLCSSRLHPGPPFPTHPCILWCLWYSRLSTCLSMMLDQSYRAVKCSAVEHGERTRGVVNTITRILFFASAYQVKPHLCWMTCQNIPVCPPGMQTWAFYQIQIMIRLYSDMLQHCENVVWEFRNFNRLFVICILCLLCAFYSCILFLSHSCSRFHLKYVYGAGRCKNFF